VRQNFPEAGVEVGVFMIRLCNLLDLIFLVRPGPACERNFFFFFLLKIIFLDEEKKKKKKLIFFW
jgi:hypothetical protein